MRNRLAIVATALVVALGTVLVVALGPARARADDALAAAEASNMRIIGRSDLNGVGKGGEGLALRQYPNGQRVLYLAHKSAPMCFSAIDVTKPEQPAVIAQIPVEAGFVRCNSLGLAGNTLIVAHRPGRGQPYAGIDITTSATRLIRRSCRVDTSGPHSRGVHYLWFVDGHYAYLSTGARDFVPRDPEDDQFMMIVDVSDPMQPHETGRWWLPGARVGDAAAAPPRVDGPIQASACTR